MSILDLYNAFGVVYQTEGHKHCRDGWVNTACPFCSGNPGLHLGCNIQSGYFYCWRCGWAPTAKAIAKLTGVDEKTAKELARKYKVKRAGRSSPSQNEKIQFKPFKMPTDCGPLRRQHQQYLEKRGFDPDQIEREWKVLGTGPVAQLDKIWYNHRIIIPIFWQGQQVSFQGRDITDRSGVKYLACPKARETIPHQSILYGKPITNDKAIIVEGVTDVWRLGDWAYAVFGIEYTHRQLRWIAKLFKEVVILFDDDPQAIVQGAILKEELEFRNRNVVIRQEIIKGDPGGMKQEDADYLVKHFTKGW